MRAFKIPRSTAVAPLLAAALALAAFARVATFGFAYDDSWTLVDNAWLTHPLAELLQLLASGGAVAKHVPDATRPVMVLFEALERRVFGLAPAGYHVDSLLLYALTCALAARLALLLTRRKHVALFAGCFFAVAPLHAEVASAINFREDLFAAIGVLGALLVVCAPAKTAAPSDGWARRSAAATLLALALLAKESAVAFVPLLGLVAFSVPWVRANLRQRRWTLAALGLVFCVWLLWRVPLALRGDDIPLAPARPLSQLVLRSARFEVLAVVHALAPWLYSPDYWRQPDATFRFIVPCVSLLVGVALLGRERESRIPALGVGIALIAPLACAPWLRPVNELADRYFFLGTLGGGLVWGWVFERAAIRLGFERLGPGIPLLALPLVLFTWPATSIWRDDRALWSAAAEITPASPRAWAGLSRVHRIAREPALADAAMARALGADPNYPPALVTQVYNDLAFGRLASAREHLAVLEEHGAGDGGGLAKAKRCAVLDAVNAARCIGP